ncbi:hypothetical protein MKEN_00352400 [Mycena kentingensis (nom. inval.)]|nr:hypothetical protein MKEN_00352400 [Mycena kentingensis (nom. inval.)]
MDSSPLLSGAATPSSYTARSEESLSIYASRDPYASFAWLLPSAIMATLATQLTASARLAFFRQYVCEEIGGLPPPDPTLTVLSSKLDCTSPSLFLGTTTVTVAAMVLTCVFSSLSTGWWSRQSDIIGRRYALMVPVVGSILLNVIFAAIVASSRFAGLAQLCVFIALAFEGLLGGPATFNAALHAYSADVAPAGRWAASFSVLQGVFLVCSVLGNSVGMGLDFFIPFLSFSVAAGIGAINLVYIFFFLPESLPEEFELDRPSKLTLGDLKSSIVSVFTAFGGQRIALLGVAFFLYSLTTKVESFHLNFALSSQDASIMPMGPGLFITLSIGARVATFLVVFPGLLYVLQRQSPLSLAVSTKHYILSVINIDASAARYSLFGDLVIQFFVLLAPASPSLIFFILSIGVPLTGGLKPAFYALIAASAELRIDGSPRRRGSLFGATSVVALVGETLSSILFVSTSNTQRSLPRAGFVLTAALLCVVALFLWPVTSAGRVIPDVLPTERERIRIVVSDEATGLSREPDSATFSPIHRRHNSIASGLEST